MKNEQRSDIQSAMLTQRDLYSRFEHHIIIEQNDVRTLSELIDHAMQKIGIDIQLFGFVFFGFLFLRDIIKRLFCLSGQSY